MGGLPPPTYGCVILIVIMLIATGGAKDDILAAGRTARRAGKSRARSADEYMGCVCVMFLVCVGLHSKMFNDPSLQYFLGVCIVWWLIIFGSAGKIEKAAKNMDAAESISHAEARSEALSETVRQMEEGRRQSAAQGMHAPILVAPPRQYGDVAPSAPPQEVSTQGVFVQPSAPPVGGRFCTRCGKQGSGNFCTGCGCPLVATAQPGMVVVQATSMEQAMKIRA
eukprot:SAG31_NODE_1160_length_9602_cov_20.626434_8_plen_224_part_00